VVLGPLAPRVLFYTASARLVAARRGCVVANVASGQPREGASPVLAGRPRHLSDRSIWTGLAAGASQGEPRGGKLSGPPPDPSPLVGMTLEVAGTGTGPAGSAGDVSGFPTASNGGLTGGTVSKGPSTGCSMSNLPDFRA